MENPESPYAPYLYTGTTPSTVNISQQTVYLSQSRIHCWYCINALCVFWQMYNDMYALLYRKFHCLNYPLCSTYWGFLN